MRAEIKQMINPVSIIADPCKPCIGSKKVQNIERINPIVKAELEYFRTERIFCVFTGVFCINSSPSNLILPSSTSQVANPIVTKDVTDLPQPDSPTTPIICPSFTESDTECKASTGPSRVSKCTLRPSISNSSDIILPPILRVDNVP